MTKPSPISSLTATSEVFVERRGKLEKLPMDLGSEDEVFRIATNIADGINRKLNPFRPLLDARLADGSRVNIISPPLAVDGTSISIRKFSRSLITLDAMAERQECEPRPGGVPQRSSAAAA